MPFGIIVNNGTISGGNAYFGGKVLGNGGQGIHQSNYGVITNNGLIEAGSTVGGILPNSAVYLRSGILINAGTIASGVAGNPFGMAVDFGSGVATLVVDPGAVFDGVVAANAAAPDVLKLPGSVVSYLGSIGSQFVNFNNIEFAPGAAWTIAGDAAGLADGVAIAGFTLGDAIILDGFAASSESFVAGAGLVLSNGMASETIGFTGSFYTSFFGVTTDGTNTRITSSTSPFVIDTVTTLGVTLGGYGLPNSLSITSAGAIATAQPRGYGIVSTQFGAYIRNSGTVLGGGYGTYSGIGGIGAVLKANGTIINAGLLAGAAGTSSWNGGAAAVLKAGGSISNSGTIMGGSGGTLASVFANLGGGADGVDAAAYLHLVNTGLITGGTGFLGVYGGSAGGGVSASGNAYVLNEGVITGAVGGGAGIDYSQGTGGVGIFLEGGTLVNDGTIAGGLDGYGTLQGIRGAAVEFGSLATVLVIDQGSVLEGAITNFGPSDTVVVSGFSAVSESFVSGTGLILSNGASTQTVNLQGSFFSAAYFNVTANGTNTTITWNNSSNFLRHLVTETVTLGSGGYADSLIIGQAGTIASLPVSAAGVVGTLAGNYLDNLGYIMAGAGANSDESGGFGGVGLILAAGGSLNNGGLLAGGSGGNGGTLGSALYPLFADHGGGGAAGASLVAGGSLNNGGTLVGGNGGSGFFGGQGGDGVDAVAGVLLINTGLIAGGTGGGGTNTAGRAGDGVSVAGSAYVLNEGVILAGTGGVGAYLGGGTLVDSGTIEGATAVQFGSVAATLVLEQGGVLQGNIVNFSSLDSIELTSFSAVSESFVTGTGLILSNGNITETLSVSGALSIADFAVTEQGSSTSIARVAAPSVINGVVSKSVTLGSTDYPGPLTVTNTGVIAPGTGGKYAHPPGVVIQDNAAYPTLTNFGTIKGSTSNIYNYAVAISSSTPADITNYGLLAGGVGMNGGTLANIHGQIVGYNGAATVFTYHGPRVGGSGAGLGRGAYLFNSGTITGGNGGGSQMGPAASGGVGVSLSSGASMTNDGVIQGGQSAYGGLMGGNGGTGLVANDSGTVVNNGQIYGGSENDGSAGSHVGGGAGVQAYGSYVRNAGTIRGGTVTGRGSDLLGGTGVALGAGKAAASLVNSGVIQGGGGVTGGAGIDLTSGDATVTNLGAVMGGAGGYGMTLGGAGGDGVTLGNHGSGDVLINAGTIAGGAGGLNGQSVAAASGAAVSFGSYAATLVVDAGAVFVGQVAANTLAADVLVLSGSDSADLALVGSQFSGFATIDIDVAGLSGTSATFGNGAVTLFNGTIGIDTLALPNFSLSATQEILVHQDGLGGTEIAIVTISNTTISGYQHQPHFDDGDHATIESGGTVDNPTINGGTLELGLGSTLSGDISFGNGGRLIIDGDVPDNTITGFAPGDTIELAGVPYLPGDSVTVANAGTVTIFENGTTYHLNIAGATVGQSFAISGDLALTAVACFCPGTRIATARGSKMVQTLRIGDVVKTVHAGLQPVKWIGTRTYAAPFCNNPRTLPIKISAGAIAAGVPRRDL